MNKLVGINSAIDKMTTNFKALAKLENVDTSGFKLNQLLRFNGVGGKLIGGKVLTDKEVKEWMNTGWIDSGAVALVDGSNKTTIHLATQRLNIIGNE